MNMTVKALAKRLLGARYQGLGKSLLACCIFYYAVRACGLRLPIGTRALCISSAVPGAWAMAQLLSVQSRALETEALLALPFQNRPFVFAYVLSLGSYTLLAWQMPVWSLLLALNRWTGLQMAAALAWGWSACLTAAAAALLRARGKAVLPALWRTGVLAAALAPGKAGTALAAALVSLAGAALYLRSADAYGFISISGERPRARPRDWGGNLLAYLIRYLLDNKSYCLNTAGLLAAACLMPLADFPKDGALPLGLALLSLNTPLCTLLSGDPALEQAVRMLPGQFGSFFRRYALFLGAVNGLLCGVYLASWQAAHGCVQGRDIWMAALVSQQSALLSALLEWIWPIRGWSTQSQLWRHPRKYLVPLLMLLAAVLAESWSPALWIGSGLLALAWAGLGLAARKKIIPQPRRRKP